MVHHVSEISHLDCLESRPESPMAADLVYSGLKDLPIAGSGLDSALVAVVVEVESAQDLERVADMPE